MVYDPDLIAALEKIISLLVILGTMIGGLITTIVVAKTGLISTKTKASTDISTVQIAKKKADAESEKNKVDMLATMEDLYTKLTEEMNKKFSEMQKELDDSEERHKKELEDFKSRIGTAEKMLDQVIKERNTLRDAGLMLIKAIEKGMSLRAQLSVGLANCNACTISDEELLKTLKEVKILFENGVKNVT